MKKQHFKIIIYNLFLLFSLPIFAQTGNGKWNFVYHDIQTLNRINPFEIHFQTANRIRACGAIGGSGEGPSVTISFDSGKTWNTEFKTGILDTNFSAINTLTPRFSTPGENLILIAPKKSKICRSPDGGKTWSYFYLPGCTSNNNVIIMRDAKIGMCFVKPKCVYQTNDSGKTWQSSASLTERDSLFVLNCRYFPSGVIYVLTWNPRSVKFYLSKSYNGGGTWEETYLDLAVNPIDEEYDCSFFTDEDTGWIATSKPVYIGSQMYNMIHKTTDGGKTWKKQLDSIMQDTSQAIDNAPFSLRGMDFWDRNNGIAVGNSKIMRTTDGGNTWKMQAHKAKGIVPGWFHSVKFIDAKTALIADVSGAILRYSEDEAVSVSDPPVLSEDVEIFPNPAASRLQVRSGRVGIRAELLTVLGRSVGFAESAGESVEFSTDSLPTGAYFVRVWSGGKMTTKAFQVSK